MVFIGALLFGLVVWAGMLWGSIAIIDRTNARNRFMAALVWSGLNLIVSLVIQEIAFVGLFFGIGYLILMVRTLGRYYELGLLQTLGVFGLMIAAPYVITPPLLRFIGDSELRGVLVLFGLPIGILGTWVWGRSRANWRAAREGLPEARVVRTAARPTADEAGPAARPAPAPQAAPAGMPGQMPAQMPSRMPAVTPSVPVVVASAAPTPRPTPAVVEGPASPSEGPRFLR